MESCLSKGSAARKFAISLGTLDYTGDLSTRLMHFSKKMEAVYKIIQNLVAQKNEDPKAYSKYFTILDDKFAWYEKAEAR